MPSRKLTDRCHAVRLQEPPAGRFCNQCGGRLDENRAIRDADGRAKLHADIAHPINSACREVIQAAVLKAYQEERERSKQPGYVCTYDDYDGDYDEVTSYAQVVTQMAVAARQRQLPVARRAPGDARHARRQRQRRLARIDAAAKASAPASWKAHPLRLATLRRSVFDERFCEASLNGSSPHQRGRPPCAVPAAPPSSVPPSSRSGARSCRSRPSRVGMAL